MTFAPVSPGSDICQHVGWCFIVHFICCANCANTENTYVNFLYFVSSFLLFGYMKDDHVKCLS